MNSFTPYRPGRMYTGHYPTDCVLFGCESHQTWPKPELMGGFQSLGICMMFGLIMPNVYILSLLTSLNIRRGWKFSHEEDCNTGSSAMRFETNKTQTRSAFTQKVRDEFFIFFLIDIWLRGFQPDIIPLGDLTFDDVESRDDVKRASLVPASNGSRLSIPSFSLSKRSWCTIDGHSGAPYIQ